MNFPWWTGQTGTTNASTSTKLLKLTVPVDTASFGDMELSFDMLSEVTPAWLENIRRKREGRGLELLNSSCDSSPAVQRDCTNSCEEKSQHGFLNCRSFASS
mmetsp:Transcript_33994/g.60245  ORF Transcript_33994/g.60245 Transcript_33994/m.60245 type:complete len:102 (+) Transcript_33994:363-668(+)